MPWLEDLKFPRGYQMGTHIFELIFENVNIGLNLGMTKRTFKMRFFKSSDALDAFVLS